MGRTGCLAIALGVATILAGAAIAIAWLVLRDPEPATIGDAVATFRTELAGRTPADSPVREGVYVYATDGYEKTDALTGATNRYPPRTTITVIRDACGFRMRWDVTDGRSTTWRVCTGRDGWTLASQDERHTFFGRTERTTYTCTGTSFRLEGDSPGVSIAYRCATPTSQERGRLGVVGRELVPVGGMEVDAVHIRRVTVLTGASRGRTRHDLWLNRETGLPVRLAMTTRTANDAPVGEVRYEEDVVLELESLDPLR